MNLKLITRELAIGDMSGGFAPRRKNIAPLVAAAGISAIAGLGSSILGGIFGSKKAREAEARLAEERTKNDNWYRRKYNESVLDTKHGQNVLRIARDAAETTWKRAKGAAAVGGGTDAAVALTKEAGNRMIGDAAANLAAQDTARKDSVDAAYRHKDSQLNQQQMAIDQQRAANTAQAASGATNALLGAAGQLASAYIQPGTTTPQTTDAPAAPEKPVPSVETAIGTIPATDKNIDAITGRSSDNYFENFDYDVFRRNGERFRNARYGSPL